MQTPDVVSGVALCQSLDLEKKLNQPASRQGNLALQHCHLKLHIHSNLQVLDWLGFGVPSGDQTGLLFTVEKFPENFPTQPQQV